jgi:leucyl aminopeptidase (aminopeptidase T)
MNTIYEKYAKLLVHYSLGLKKGDKLLISSTYLAEPLIKEVYREALTMRRLPSCAMCRPCTFSRSSHTTRS